MRDDRTQITRQFTFGAYNVPTILTSEYFPHHMQHMPDVNSAILEIADHAPRYVEFTYYETKESIHLEICLPRVLIGSITDIDNFLTYIGHHYDAAFFTEENRQEIGIVNVRLLSTPFVSEVQHPESDGMSDELDEFLNSFVVENG